MPDYIQRVGNNFVTEHTHTNTHTHTLVCIFFDDLTNSEFMFILKYPFKSYNFM